MFKSAFTERYNIRRFFRSFLKVPCRVVTVWEKAVVIPEDFEQALEGLRKDSVLFKENDKRGQCRQYLGWDKVTFSKKTKRVYLSRRVSKFEHYINMI